MSEASLEHSQTLPSRALKPLTQCKTVGGLMFRVWGLGILSLAGLKRVIFKTMFQRV